MVVKTGFTADKSSSKYVEADAAHAVAATAKANAGTTATVADKERAVPVAAPAPVETMKLELVGHARLHYNGILYEAGTVYEHSRAYAEHLLSLVGSKQLPQFKMYQKVKPKPRTESGKPMMNMVAIKTATTNAVPEPKVPSAEQATAAGAGRFNLEDGEVDQELEAHLQAHGGEPSEQGEEGTEPFSQV